MYKKKEPLIYYYRGLIESSSGWIEGYSPNGLNGGVIYPWSGKSQCKQEAVSEGKTAFFVRNFKVGDFVEKNSKKPFKNGESNQMILGFKVNEKDPKRRLAAVFSDDSICNLDQLKIVPSHLCQTSS